MAFVDRLSFVIQLLFPTKGLAKSCKVDKLFGQFPLWLYSLVLCPGPSFLGSRSDGHRPLLIAPL